MVECFGEQWGKACNFSKVSEEQRKQSLVFAFFLILLLDVNNAQVCNLLQKRIWPESFLGKRIRNVFKPGCLELLNKKAPAGIQVLNGSISVFTQGIARLYPPQTSLQLFSTQSPSLLSNLKSVASHYAVK